MSEAKFSTTYEETIDLMVRVEDNGIRHALIFYLMRKVDPNYEYRKGAIHDYYQIYQNEFDRVTEDIDDAPKVLVPIIEYIRNDDLYEQISSIYIE